MTTIKIYTCYHKPENIVANEVITPIQVGAEKAQSDFGILRDDSGDNISGRNKNFCELSATYWIWKNSQADYVGLGHYRRFFNFKTSQTRFNSFDKLCQKFGMTADKILPIFEEYDMILPRKYEFGGEKGTIYKAYIEGHAAKDMNIALDFIKKKFPDMAPEVDSFKNEHNQMYPCNMLVCRKKLFDEYAQWLFAVLFEVEKNIKDELPLRDSYQQRALGFLGERMTKIFVDYKIRTTGLKVKEMPFLFYEENQADYEQYLKEYYHRQRKMLKRKILTAIGLGKKKWQAAN